MEKIYIPYIRDIYTDVQKVFLVPSRYMGIKERKYFRNIKKTKKKRKSLTCFNWESIFLLNNEVIFVK